MPRCARTCGGKLLICSPRKAIAPSLNESWPVIKLNIVVLPAPLGPIMLRISPRSISNDTVSTAINPLKRRTAFSTERKGVLVMTASCCGCGAQQDYAKHDQMAARDCAAERPAQKIFNRHNQQSADNGAHDGADAADQRDQRELDADIRQREQGRRIKYPHVHCEYAAADSGQRG